MKNLPALDDLELRKKNTKKIVDTVESFGNFIKTAQKEKRVGIITAFVILSFLILIVCGSFVYVYFKSDGEFLGNIFDVEQVTQRYVCNNNIGEDNATFRDPKKALEFIELYNQSTCIYYSTKK